MREEQSIPVNNSKHKPVWVYDKKMKYCSDKDTIKLKLTQLLVTLAKMIAQVGNFDKRSRKDGFGFIEMVGWWTGFPAWISLSSDLVMKGLSRGLFVTPLDQVDTHNRPKEAKRINGPEIPIEDNMSGVNRSPTTFPMWNPAIDIPTALARSSVGNQLRKRYYVT